MVQYEELLSISKGGGQKQQGMIPTGRGMDAARRGSSLQLCTSLNPRRMLLRPRTPALSVPSPSSSPPPPPAAAVRWSKGLCVDVLWRKTWWEGILLEDISLEKARLGVHFPDEGGQNVFIIKDLQLYEQWDEETARWSLKAHGKLPLLKPSSFPSSQSPSSQKRNLWKREEQPVVGAKKLIFKSMKPKPVKIVGSVKAEQDSDDDLSCARLERLSRFSCIPGRRAVMAPAQPLPTSPSSDTSKLRKFANGQARNNYNLSELQEHKRMKLQEVQLSGRRESLRSGIRIKQEEEQGSRNGPHTVELPISEGTLHHLRNSYRVVKREEVFTEGEAKHFREELVEMIIHQQQQRHHTEKSRGFGSVEASSTIRSSSVGISMVLRRQPPRRSVDEEGFDRAELNANVGMEKNLHKVIQYRKRLPANMQHCSLPDTERQCKKSRCGAIEGGPHAVVDMLPQLTQDEEAAAAAPRGSKSVGAVHKGLGVQEKIGKKKGGRGGCRMEVKLSAPVDSAHDAGGLSSVNAKKSILSWLVDLGMLVENQKLRYVHRTRKEIALNGWVTPEGVLCSCCKTILTLSMFEAHCGSKLHRPCANIYIEDGRSLTELQMEALKNQSPSERPPMFSHPATTGLATGLGTGLVKRRRGATTKVKECAADGNDDTCGVCGDGGMLICCDHCPSTFHLACMELQAVPEEDWFCPNCRCAICGGPPVNANPDEFNEMTVLSCDQCEREFHLKCLYAKGLPKLDHCPQGNWLCGHSCEKIFQGLRGLVGTCNPLEDGYSWTLLRSQEEDSDLSQIDKEVMAEQKIKLAIALSVMQECFKPMIDPCTKLDIVAHAIYNRGSEVSRLNYHGFYTVILEKGDELISVATVRIHGAHLAEMPLIGTRFQYRRQGMCRRLVHALELMLQMVGVQTLVLPAVPEMQDYWTGPFGFQPLKDSLKRTLLELNLLVFPGTSILQKPLAIPAAHPDIASADLEGKAHWLPQDSESSALCTAVSKGARIRRSTIRCVAGEFRFVQSEVSKERKKSPEVNSGGVLESSTACELAETVPSATALEEDTVSLPVADTSVDPQLADSPNHDRLSEGSLVHASEDDVVLLGTDIHGSLQQSHADVPRTEDMPHHQNGYQGDRCLEARCEPKELEEDPYMVEPVVDAIRAKLLVDALSPTGREGCSTYIMSTDIPLQGREAGLVDAQGSVPDTEGLRVLTAEIIATSAELESSHPSATSSGPLFNFPKPRDYNNKTGYHILDKEGRLGFEVSAFGDTMGQPECGGTTKGQGSDSLFQSLLNYCKDVREGAHPTSKIGQPESQGATMQQTGDYPIQETTRNYRVSLASCSMDTMERAPSTCFIRQVGTSDDSMQEMSPSMVSMAKSSKDAIEGGPLACSTRELEIKGQPGDTLLQGLQNFCEDAREVGSATPSKGLSEIDCTMTGPAGDHPEFGSMSGVLVAKFPESSPSTPSRMGHLDSGCARSGQAGDDPIQELVSPSRVSSANFFKDAMQGTVLRLSSEQLDSRRATTGQVGDYAVQESASPSRTSSTSSTEQATDTVPSTPRMGQLSIGGATPAQVGNSPMLDSLSPSKFSLPLSLSRASTPEQPPSPECQVMVGDIVSLKDELFPIPIKQNGRVSEDGMNQFPAAGCQDVTEIIPILDSDDKLLNLLKWKSNLVSAPS